MAYENGKYTPPAFLDVNALMGGGFKIPDGYKGVVEDGVFRLVDTMDPNERIRENIVLYFKNERQAQVGEIENKWIPWIEERVDPRPREDQIKDLEGLLDQLEHVSDKRINVSMIKVYKWSLNFQNLRSLVEYLKKL